MAATNNGLKILFMLNDFVGPQNACIGLAQTLADRGHRIYFCIEKEFVGKFSSYGFDEKQCLLLLNSENEQQKLPTLEVYVEKLLSYGFVSDKNAFEKVCQMSKVNLVKATFEDKLKQFDGQLKRYLGNIEPDLIIYDGEVISPAILFWPKCPWIYLFCSHPIGLFDSDLLPPFLSDFPTQSDSKLWQQFRLALDQHYFSLIRNAQTKLCQQLGYGKMEESGRFFIHSPYLNIYQYPLELDYADIIDIPANCFNVDAFCRQQLKNVQLKIPDKFLKRSFNQKLIYFSLGSMGSSNLKLMRKILNILSLTKHLYLVSKGPLGDQLELSENMYGENVLPQIYILNNFNVDLAIIHGGNNSFTEAIYFGVPSIIMPLFYDQFHNAQRVQEKQVGARVDPFHMDDGQLISTIDSILQDDKLINRVKNISLRIQKSDRKSKCAEKLEKIAEQFKMNLK